MENREIQEGSERSMDIFWLLFFSVRSSFVLLLVCVTMLGVVLYLRVFSLGCVRVRPVTLSPSLMLISPPIRAAFASWSVKGSGVAAELHSFATVLLSCDSSTKKA